MIGRSARAAVTAAALAAVLAGCGNGSSPDASDEGPPTDASVEDFCQVFDDFTAAATELGEDAETADRIQAIKQVGKDLEEVGTPADISDEARAGFEVTTEAIANIPDDASEDEMDKYIEDSFTDEEQKQSDAFDEYVSTTCEAA